VTGLPPAIDLLRLESYLAAELGLAGLPAVTQFSTGHSNPTYLLEYPDLQVVLRSQPPGPLLPKAHAVDREFAIQRSLEGSGLPVPKMLALCTDPEITGGMFYLMEYVPGRVLNDPWLPEVAPAERRPVWFALADTLAALHGVEPDAAVFGEDRGGYLERQTARWTKNYRAADVEPSPAMDEVAEWLGQQHPTESLHRISHGDFRPGNLVYAPDRADVRAILDWELATTGDPCADLAYSCLPWYVSRASGRLSRLRPRLRGDRPCSRIAAGDAGVRRSLRCCWRAGERGAARPVRGALHVPHCGDPGGDQAQGDRWQCLE